MDGFDYTKLQRALQEIREIARKAETDCFPVTEVIHPRNPDDVPKRITVRVDVEMESGKGFVRSFMMDPYNVQVSQSRPIDKATHKPSGPAMLTIRGTFGGAENQPK